MPVTLECHVTAWGLGVSVGSTVAASAIGEARRLVVEARRLLAEGRVGEALARARRARALLSSVEDNPLASPGQREAARRLLARLEGLEAEAGRAPVRELVGGGGDSYFEAARAYVWEPRPPRVEPVGLEEPLERLAWAVGLHAGGPRSLAPKGVLLYGPPGTGKTLLVAAAAARVGVPVVEMPVHAVLSKYVGDTPKMVHAFFEVAKSLAPSILFIDEAEALAVDRDRDRGPATGLAQALFRELDGLESKAGYTGVLVVAATNKPWILDPAFRRRLDAHVYVPPPGPEARWRILHAHLEEAGLEVDGSVTREWFTRATEGYTGGDIARLVREAAWRMLRRVNRGPPRRGERPRIAPLTRGDLEAAMENVKPTVTPRLLELYEVWRRERGG